VTNKAFLIIGLAFAVGTLSAPSAIAQSFDGTWRGKINCAKLSFARVPGDRVMPIEINVSGSTATYTREVHNRAGSAVIGTEEGSGTVANDGAIRLTADFKPTAADSQFTYTASFRGRFHPATGRLRGTQVWSNAGRTENRSCYILLSR